MRGGSRIEGAGPGGRVLLILLLAYIFNFIDRQIIGVLALPIKAELAPQRQAIGADGRDRLRALLFGPRHPDRLARRPQEPGQHHRRLGGAVEPVHRRLRLRPEFLAIVPGADGGRHRRGGRRRAVLRADLGFLSEGEARAGARLLLARHPDRLGARRLLRRLDRQPSRLALGLPDRRPRRPARGPAGRAVHPRAGARRLRRAAPSEARAALPHRRGDAGAQRRASGCSRSAPPRARSSATA